MNGARKIDLFAIKVLRAYAWVNLIACSAFSLMILHEYGVTFVTEEELLYNYIEKVINPFAITVSLVSFLLGIAGWAFCLVIAHMAENLIALRRCGKIESLPEQTESSISHTEQP
jgi:ABC-type spermidine/putrescine transport system permease subunit I